MSQQISASLTAILDLEQLESNLFRGRSPKSTWPRVFGGQVIAQSLYAACKTVEDRQPHSLHAYFLLPGDPEMPIVYEVDRLRDGRSFTTRRVLAIQKGEAIFAMSASFQVDEPGYEHQMPMPDVPMPEDLPDREEMAKTVLPHMPDAVQAYYQRKRPIEIRPVELERYRTGGKMEPKFNVWIRAMETLPNEPALHRSVLAYASDLMLLDSSLIAHGTTVFDQKIQGASLDHALWFHRPFRADEWLLYAQDSPSTSGARGFSRGLVFDREGRLVASVAQEGLIRPRPDRA
ncbi:acyl-CoA thioesterase II [Bosea sp. SSUT16]|jgi:acyl-CoA thioesterase-2|uniref:Acyl-CoA thioesterase 2 n=1 Tax=Bosea spartocytisi TaxID=2773451 RepID=A0A927EF14_9HYPH|nr:acyl-CoA thioesterase II [Bosea spartocytisi]MBD3849292.1 acyl-CoA thioesterase II [Bosea spartocytisi]MCT4475093.1 acyl-CoA thioesterase II [Bosea spartocytisi]